jgi:hypothetical protein
VALLLITVAGAWYAACTLYGEAEMFKISCAVFGVLAMILALYTCFHDLPCWYLMALDYVKHFVFNALGVCMSLAKLLESLTVHNSLSSCFVMHLILVGTVITFSNQLLATYSSSKMLLEVPCQGWAA